MFDFRLVKGRVAALSAAVLTCLSGFPPAAQAESVSVTPRMTLSHRIANSLRRSGWSDEAIVVGISALPIVELRGAIPAGHMLKGHDPDHPERRTLRERIRDGAWVYGLAVIGNMLPVPLILWLLGPLSSACMRTAGGRAFFNWVFARTRRKTAGIEKYETLGLTVFVAIPLPATGAWTGAVAAFLMGLRFWHAMVSILLGVMIAGVIMTVLSLMGWFGALVAGAVLIGLAVSALLGVLRGEEEKKEQPRRDAN